jgi:hypothetical protein
VFVELISLELILHRPDGSDHWSENGYAGSAFTEFDQEKVLLMSIDAKEYYGLKGPARSITDDLETRLTFSPLVDRLAKETVFRPRLFLRM